MLSYSRKIKQTLPTFQVYGPIRYRKCKTDIVIPRERGPSKEQEKNGTRKGGTLIHALKKRLKERGKRKPLRRGWPPNLLNIAFCGLRLLACILTLLLAPKRSRPCSKCPCSMRIHEMTKETSQQTSKETNRRKAC